MGFLSKSLEAETGDTESEQDSGGSGQSLSLKAQVMETDKPEFKSYSLKILYVMNLQTLQNLSFSVYKMGIMMITASIL